MANRVNVEITANTSGYKNALDEAKGANKQFQSSIEDIDIKGLNREFRQSQKYVQGLALEMAKMQKAGHIDTASYKALQREFIEAKKHAAELKDVVGDVQEEVKHLASDTKGWDAFKEGINIAKDGMMAFAALTGSEKELESTLQTLAQIQTVANTAISIGNALQKQSALMSGIRSLQEAALAKAIDLETAATGRATIAQKLFNAVAKANPYVLLGTAVLTLVAAIGTYIAVTKESTQVTATQKQVMDALAESQNTYNSTFTQTASQSLSTLKRLQAEWKTLQTTAQKTQWIKDNQKEFDKLGVTVNNIVDAENVFVNNTGNVVQALINRAKGAAEAAKAQLLYAKALEQEEKAKQRREQLDKDLENPNRLTVYKTDANGNYYQHTETKQEAINRLTQAYLNDLYDIRDVQNKINQEADEHIRKSVELNGITSKSGSGTNKPSGGTTTKPKKEEIKIDVKSDTLELAKYSLKELEDMLSEIRRKRTEGLLPEFNAEQYIGLVDRFKEAIENKKIELGVEVAPNELEQIQKKISDLKARQLNVNTRLDPQQFQQELKKLENEEHEVKIKIGYEVEESGLVKLSKSIEDKLKGHNIPIEFDPEVEPSKLDTLKRELEQYTYVQEHISLSDEDLNKIKAKIKELKGEIESEEIHVGVSNVVTNKVVEEKESQKQDLQNKATTLINENGGVPEPNTEAYSELVEYLTQIRDLTQEISDLQDPLAAQEAAMVKQTKARAQALQGIGGAISGLGSAMAQLGDKEDKGVQVAALIAQAIGSVLAGMGTAIASAGQTGNPWVWLAFSVAALATAATTIAQIKNLGASAKGYATGGFIGGNSFSGDKVPILANSGEAILNPNQQRRFMQYADGMVGARDARNAGLSVTTIGVEGSELLLAINNSLQEQGKNTIG